MSAIFPSKEWLQELEAKLNSDSRYREVAKHWEGDLLFRIQEEGHLQEPLVFYLDLWHGTCRRAEYQPDASSYQPAFTLSAKYNDIVAVLAGKLNPMTAMMTMKLKVSGNMGYMMRNVPVVLDFVRCAQEVTQDIL